MNRSSKWALAWVLWLVAFLAVEVPAALRKAKLDTLSEHVSKLWFPRIWQRSVLAVFMLTLTSHFVFEWPGGPAIIATGAPVALIIANALRKSWD
jgi:hypothetical protein